MIADRNDWHQASPSGAQIQKEEEMLSNSVIRASRLTVCIPTFHDSADALILKLASIKGAYECSLLVFDDGSLDNQLSSRLSNHIMSFPGPANLITSSRNLGRSGARNRLEQTANSEWLLFLDADMLPDDDDFLLRYLEVARSKHEPALVAGGFSLKQAQVNESNALHAAQSLRSECISADLRSKEPGRFVFTSNILVHRKILETVSFSADFVGWGWEDVDWGLRVAKVFPIIHIENTATHLGLDSDDGLIKKYEGSGPNFALLVSRNLVSMRGTPLYRISRMLRPIPGLRSIQEVAKGIARQRALPIGLRLFALKLFRSAVYAECIDRSR